MNEPSDQFDPLLEQWASRREPTAERLAKLRGEILRQATGVQPLSSASLNWLTKVGRGAAAALAVAALLGVSVLVWRGQPVVEPVVAELPQTRLPQQHLSKLLAEMNALFDERLAWVAETNREVLIGLDDENVKTSSGARIAVRIVVLQKQPDSDRWQTVWTGDIATRSEARVQVSQHDGSQLQLWAHVLPDGAVSIDSQFARSSTEAPIWTSSAIQQPDIPTQIVSEEHGDGEFRVWQTALLLPEASL